MKKWKILETKSPFFLSCFFILKTGNIHTSDSILHERDNKIDKKVRGGIFPASLKVMEGDKHNWW